MLCHSVADIDQHFRGASITMAIAQLEVIEEIEE
jgi:hypothetical protein